MIKKRWMFVSIMCISIISVMLAGCDAFGSNSDGNQNSKANAEDEGKNSDSSPANSGNVNQPSDQDNEQTNDTQPEEKPDPKPAPNENGDSVQVAAAPDSITVLVNKTYMLPENYEPKDLVYVNIPFTFKEKIDKRKLRKEAADALVKLVDGAKQDSIYLAGVSGYRSYSTQKALFNSYVQQSGEEAAKKYSAEPGHSEHETGLAIDLSGSTGKCAAEDCFAGTPEALWLADHAHEYGFIIRYPEGKEDITGYQYEPWHIRYVGTDLAKELYESDLTMEEYRAKQKPDKPAV